MSTRMCAHTRRRKRTCLLRFTVQHTVHTVAQPYCANCTCAQDYSGLEEAYQFARQFVVVAKEYDTTMSSFYGKVEFVAWYKEECKLSVKGSRECMHTRVLEAISEGAIASFEAKLRDAVKSATSQPKDGFSATCTFFLFFYVSLLHCRMFPVVL